MRDRIRVNGQLYEAVDIKDNGKFGQLKYEDYGNVDISIINGNKILFDFRWNKKFESSFYSIGHEVTKDLGDFFAAEGEVSRSTVKRIYDYILDMDSSLTRPWTDNDVEKLSDYLERHFDYLFCDDYLKDMDSTWYDVREYDEGIYEDYLYEVIAGDESPDILFDYSPAYDEIQDEIRSAKDDLDALNAEYWRNQGI